jgi:hypothetical protein
MATFVPTPQSCCLLIICCKAEAAAGAVIVLQLVMLHVAPVIGTLVHQHAPQLIRHLPAMGPVLAGSPLLGTVLTGMTVDCHPFCSSQSVEVAAMVRDYWLSAVRSSLP